MSEPIEGRVSSTRAELSETLDAIEDRVNPVKQARRLKARVTKSFGKNPTPFIIAGVAAVVVAGGSIVRAITSSDD